MSDKEIMDQLRELDRLYAEHAGNQDEVDFQRKNKLRVELLDLFLALKPHIKKQTNLQWYEPTYNYAITGNLEYIEAARGDLAHIIRQYEKIDPSEKT